MVDDGPLVVVETVARPAEALADDSVLTVAPYALAEVWIAPGAAVRWPWGGLAVAETLTAPAGAFVSVVVDTVAL
jgi:hypothetical protein